MKQTIYTKVEQFLCDDDFIRYVMDCVPDKESYWTSYLSAAPQIRSAHEVKSKQWIANSAVHSPIFHLPSAISHLTSAILHQPSNFSDS